MMTIWGLTTCVALGICIGETIVAKSHAIVHPPQIIDNEDWPILTEDSAFSSNY